eukprot:scaffold105628_cov24-Phaeocystis_antarctica.AAC.1
MVSVPPMRHRRPPPPQPPSPARSVSRPHGSDPSSAAGIPGRCGAWGTGGRPPPQPLRTAAPGEG